MKKPFAVLALIPAIALASATANAKVVPLGTSSTANPFFDVTTASAGDTTVTAILGDTVSGADMVFDDLYTFTLPLNGTGSGSVSTSTSGTGSTLTISAVIVNGVTYTAAEAAAGIDDVPITAYVLDTIEIIGTTGPGAVAGVYAGTATFEATSVPEPMSWTTFLLGFGFMGLALRRKFGAQAKAA